MAKVVINKQELIAANKKRLKSEVLRTRVMPTTALFLFFVLWEVLTRVNEVPSYLLPPPSEIIVELFLNIRKILDHSWITAYEMLLGYALAILVAVPLAIFSTASKSFDQFITPILLFFQTVPKIAIAPLFLVWFGVGPFPKILVAFLISFFPIIIDTAVGLRSISPDMLDLAKSMGATPLQTFMRFRLPTSLPYLFSGLKVASTLAVVGAVVGEFVGADQGLGYLLLVTNSNLQTAQMFGVIIALTLQGLILYYLIQWIEDLLIPWHITVRANQGHGTM
ncbi:MAG: ABC transporter permease [Chloroflexi bacterium]|nr:MAG: ABC transporter permease [Chloroflexota bacterium]